jgi:hypothetical protein
VRTIATEVRTEKMDERPMAGFITGLKSVEEVEAGIFEVVVTLQRGATAKLRMNAFTFQAFVTKFIQAPRADSWLDKPIYWLKKIIRPLCITKAPFGYSRKQQ